MGKPYSAKMVTDAMDVLAKMSNRTIHTLHQRESLGIAAMALLFSIQPENLASFLEFLNSFPREMTRQEEDRFDQILDPGGPPGKRK